ncbi:MAG: protease B nonderepressible form [Stictis urceolatum]|nr:protease B nonderepressible form [Stictis urceolata]
MRERITFVHARDDPYDPQQLRVEKDALHVENLKAAREDRISFGFQELPQEIWLGLKQCHELHIRWVSSTSYTSISPFNSRLSPGLHVFLTPHKNNSASLLCPLLKKTFGEQLDCRAPADSFTSVPVLSERFASSASQVFYQSLDVPVHLLAYVTQKICKTHGEPCLSRAAALAAADYIDMDYDAISQALVVRTFRQMRAQRPAWNVTIEAIKDSRLEVGILSSEKPAEPDPETLKMSGFLTVIREDSKANPTLFEFPSRHHISPPAAASSYAARFLQPTGLHPTLQLAFNSSSAPPSEQCALHSYFTLPSTLFPDKYQLSGPLFLASKNLGPIRAISGETDLEAPDWAVSRWGSSMLIELAPPSPDADVPWTAEIPLHLRYLPPTPGGLTQAGIPWPTVFWACRAEEGSKMGVNPFDRVNVGYEGLFGPRTMFYHLSPNETKPGGLMERIDVPVLDTTRTAWVGPGTALTITAGLFWVLYKVLLVATGTSESRDRQTKNRGCDKKSQ